MPHADENLPGAAGQAMALHYAPKVRHNTDVTASQPRRQQRHAMPSLPDLSDRLKKLGMFESYKAWGENYANWRLGAATGAKGEATSAIQKERLMTDVSKAGPRGLPDLSERLRQSGIYEAYQAWGQDYNQWRKGSAKGAKGELSSNSAAHKRMSRASTKKVDWPEAAECLPTAEGQARLLQSLPRVQQMSLQHPPQPHLPVSRPNVSWPEAEGNLPSAHGQAMACHFQPRVVLAR